MSIAVDSSCSWLGRVHVIAQGALVFAGNRENRRLVSKYCFANPGRMEDIPLALEILASPQHMFVNDDHRANVLLGRGVLLSRPW